MQTVKPITTLTNSLTKNNFEVKEVQKNKSIIAMRKNFPRLFFEITKGGIKVRNVKELNDRAIKENSILLSAINELNKSTLLSKYYLQADNKLNVEAILLVLGTEKEFATLINILKNDMKQLLENYKPIKKYLVA